MVLIMVCDVVLLFHHSIRSSVETLSSLQARRHLGQHRCGICLATGWLQCERCRTLGKVDCNVCEGQKRVELFIELCCVQCVLHCNLSHKCQNQEDFTLRARALQLTRSAQMSTISGA